MPMSTSGKDTYTSVHSVCHPLHMQASSSESVEQMISCKLWSLAAEKLNVVSPSATECIKLPEVDDAHTRLWFPVYTFHVLYVVLMDSGTHHP